MDIIELTPLEIEVLGELALGMQERQLTLLSPELTSKKSQKLREKKISEALKSIWR